MEMPRLSHSSHFAFSTCNPESPHVAGAAVEKPLSCTEMISMEWMCLGQRQYLVQKVRFVFLLGYTLILN
jgi:hypothetical protein